MTIRFKCTVCGFSSHVEDSMGGKSGKCPKCQAVLRVPAATPQSKKPRKRVWMDRWNAFWTVDPQVTAKAQAADYARRQAYFEEEANRRKELLARSEAEILTAIEEKVTESLGAIETDVRETRSHAGCILTVMVVGFALALLSAFLQAISP